MGIRSVVIPAMFVLAVLSSVAAYGQQVGGNTSYIIGTIAGTGAKAYSGDNGPASLAELAGPWGLAFDGEGDLYIADFWNSRIRKVSLKGIITTVAGNGTPGFSGDGGPATSAQLSLPKGIAVDKLGNLYIADSGNGRVRKVTPAGLITTVAGTDPWAPNPCLGDGCAATAVRLREPQAVAVASTGELFLADSLDVLRVSSTGRVNKLSVRELGRPGGLAFDPAGNLYIGGTHSWLPDAGVWELAPDGTSLRVPVGVFGAALAVDTVGNLYIAGNGLIRKVSRDGIIVTVAGGGTGV